MAFRDEEIRESFQGVAVTRDVYDPNRGSKLGSWLGLLAINTTYDYLRATTRRPILDKLDANLKKAMA